MIASLSGALRTGSALDRLREQENAPDAVVFASQVDAWATRTGRGSKPVPR